MLTYLVWLILLHPVVKLAFPQIVDISGWRRGHELVLCTSLSKLVNVLLGKILPSIPA